MNQMTSLERCQAVLNGQVADRIPVVPQSFMLAAETAGIKIGELPAYSSSIRNFLPSSSLIT